MDKENLREVKETVSDDDSEHETEDSDFAEEKDKVPPVNTNFQSDSEQDDKDSQGFRTSENAWKTKARNLVSKIPRPPSININKQLVLTKIFYFFFFAAVGSLLPFLGVFYKQLWLSATQVGVLIGVRPTVKLLCSPLWGMISDTYNKPKMVLLVAILGWLVGYYGQSFISPSTLPCYNATEYANFTEEDKSAHNPLLHKRSLQIKRFLRIPGDKGLPEISDQDPHVIHRRSLFLDEDFQRGYYDNYERFARSRGVLSNGGVKMRQRNTLVNSDDKQQLMRKELEDFIAKNFKQYQQRTNKKFLKQQVYEQDRQPDSNEQQVNRRKLEIPDPGSQNKPNIHDGGSKGLPPIGDLGTPSHLKAIDTKLHKKTLVQKSNRDSDSTTYNSKQREITSSMERKTSDQVISDGKRIPPNSNQDVRSEDDTSKGSDTPMDSHTSMDSHTVMDNNKHMDSNTPKDTNIHQSPFNKPSSDDATDTHFELAEPDVSIFTGPKVSSPHPPFDYRVMYNKQIFMVLLTIIILSEILATPAPMVVDSGTLQLLEMYGKRKDYGKQRLFGSIGWIVGAILVGGIVTMNVPCNYSDTINYVSCFYVFGGFMILTFIVATQFEFETTPKLEYEVNRETLIRALKSFCNFKAGTFLLTVFFCGYWHSIFMSFLFWFLQDIEGTPIIFSLVLIMNSLTEVLVFFTSDYIIQYWSNVGMICMGLVCYGVRFLFYTYLGRPWLVLPMEVLQGFTFGGIWTAAMNYVNNMKGTSQSHQSLLHGIYWGLGMAIGGIVSGVMIDYLGTRLTFFINAIAVLVNLAVFWFAHREESTFSSQASTYQDEIITPRKRKLTKTNSRSSVGPMGPLVPSLLYGKHFM